MLKVINNEIMPTVWLNLKNMRMFFMQYLMLVIIYPLTYLIISMISSGGNGQIGIYLSGMFVSVVISLFINMQATLIVSANNINTIEMYTVYQIKPLNVFIGNSVFHFLMEMPLLIIVLILGMVNNLNISIGYVLLWMFVSFIFLTAFSIYIGGLIRNPNLASPIINMLYMFIVMLTPLYNDVTCMEKSFGKLYMLNPLTHIVSLFRKGIGLDQMCNPIISIVVLTVLSIIMFRVCISRWKDTRAIEKLNLF